VGARFLYLACQGSQFAPLTPRQLRHCLTLYIADSDSKGHSWNIFCALLMNLCSL